MAYANATHHSGFGIRSLVDSFFSGLSERRMRAAEYRRVHDELSAMSDRDLADIGINRGLIDDIARKAAQAV